jgi:hypothetical protein
MHYVTITDFLGKESAHSKKETLKGTENVPLMCGCSFYAGSNYIHYLSMRTMILSFIYSDMLYISVL